MLRSALFSAAPPSRKFGTRGILGEQEAVQTDSQTSKVNSADVKQNACGSNNVKCCRRRMLPKIDGRTQRRGNCPSAPVAGIPFHRHRNFGFGYCHGGLPALSGRKDRPYQFRSATVTQLCRKDTTVVTGFVCCWVLRSNGTANRLKLSSFLDSTK